MKSFLTLFFALIFSGVFSQTITIEPDWEVGDTKTIKTFRENKEYRGEGEPIIMFDTTEGPVIKVVAEDEGNFFIETEVQDQNLMMMNSLIQNFEIEMDTDEKVNVRIAVSKEGKGWSIANFEDIKKNLEEKIDKVKAAMNAKNPQMAEMMFSYLEPVSSGVKTEEAMKFTFLKDIEFLFLPFQRSWEVDKMYQDSASGPNPMNPAINTTYKYENKVSKVDKKENIATFNQETFVDMEGFIKMIKEKLQQMAAMMDDPEKAKELDDVEMSMTNQMKLEVNIKTGWVVAAYLEAVIEGKIPGENKKSASKVRRILE